MVELQSRETILIESSPFFANPETFDGPFYMNGEWMVTKKEAITKSNIFTYVELRLTLERRTTIYTFFIVLPYLLSVLFILTMMIVHLDSAQKYLFAGCSIFIQLLLIMFILSHLGFLSGSKAPRAIRCMSVNILFTVCTVCLSTLMTVWTERMKSSRLPLLVESVLNNELVGKIFVLDLESNRLDSNLIPFVNEEENERTANENAIEIQDSAPVEPHSGQSEAPSILVLEKSLSEGELFNLKRWMLFRTLVDRLVLYSYLVVLVTFHI